MAEGEVIQVGKNTKVGFVATAHATVSLARWIELEAVSAEAVNRTVKAVVQARQTLEIEGYSLVIIPKLVGRSTPGSTAVKRWCI